ncbi:AMP-binding protein, partial [Chromobacterium vaccinii]|uniref:AMP-binding protein n=1 Tax=Chromobacterium vaccinii TaxID=1108595 RepID=UPI0006182290
LEYNADLFDRDTVEAMARRFLRLLSAAARAPQTRLKDLPLLDEDEQRLLLRDWGQGARSDAAPDLLAGFERQAMDRPAADAVRYEGEALSYGELNGRANQLAHWLRGKGVGPDALVGLCMERGLEMVVGLLGILKAGGAYVPLDPEHPAERLALLLEDTGAKLVLTQSRLRPGLPAGAAETLSLDGEWEQVAGCDSGNP